MEITNTGVYRISEPLIFGIRVVSLNLERVVK
jgi:hypothetical protein